MLASESMKDFKYSPDAIHLSEEGILFGGYETKSKMGKKHIEYILKDEVPPEHLMQCLAPMIMYDSVRWWLFGHYDDRNKINSLFTKGIRRSDYEEFINVARVELANFFAEVDKTVEKMGGTYDQ